MDREYILKHEILGDIKLEVGERSIIAFIDDKRVHCNIYLYDQGVALRFFDKVFAAKLNKKLEGLKISRVQENEIREIMEQVAKDNLNEEYEKWLKQKASYHSTYGFGTFAENYNQNVQKIVSEKLTLIDTDIGDYSITYNYEETNEVVIKLLDEEQKLFDEKKRIRAEQKELDRKKKIEELTRLAKETGEDQLYSSYSVDCNDPSEACDIDNICTYITPSGEFIEVRQHTW